MKGQPMLSWVLVVPLVGFAAILAWAVAFAQAPPPKPPPTPMEVCASYNYTFALEREYYKARVVELEKELATLRPKPDEKK